MLIERLLRMTGIEREYLLWVAETASKRYKIYEINKRNGGKREIAHPARGLKALQRWLNKVVFSKFPVHTSATAYKRGASIKINAIKHAHTNFTLRLDYKDFFPSFDKEILFSFLNKKSKIYGIDLSEDDISFICKVITKDGRLTIGAPSSPIITNAIMYEFDNEAYEACLSKDLIYTRYADDIFISSRLPNKLNSAQKIIHDISKRKFGTKLQFNTEKTCFLSRKYKRKITGIILTSDYKISIGRKKKREIRTLVYKYTIDDLSPLEIWRTRGILAFCMDVEPEFFATLLRKYGETAINSLMSDKRLESKKVIGSLRRARFLNLKKKNIGQSI